MNRKIYTYCYHWPDAEISYYCQDNDIIRCPAIVAITPNLKIRAKLYNWGDYRDTNKLIRMNLIKNI